MAAQEEYGGFFRSEDKKERVEYAELHTRIARDFRERIREEYGVIIPATWNFYNLGQDSVWLVPIELKNFDIQDFNFEIKGLYFSHYDGKYLRLSPEGAQIVGANATKNVLDITNEEAEKMIRGYDLDKETSLPGEFVILRCPKGIIGVGKNHRTKILCQIAKKRRVHQI